MAPRLSKSARTWETTTSMGDRRAGWSAEPVGDDVVPNQVLVGLTADEQIGPAFVHQHHGGATKTVVVARHRIVVRAGGLDGQQIAGPRVGQEDVGEEDIGLA